MAKRTEPSRLSLSYLASRYAGMLFFCLALGLCCGMAWRMLMQPSRYAAESSRYFSADGPFDWQERTNRWQDITITQTDRDLLGSNLRHMLKLATTEYIDPDPARLGAELALFDPARVFSTTLWPTGHATEYGPNISLTRHDLAANLDFQTLAAIVSDLDPSRGADQWNFSFFTETVPPTAGTIVHPGPDDHYFAVFYALHRSLRPGREPSSPEEAWRTAVEEVALRLDREADFEGGGGFGTIAKREILREIFSIRSLAANGLYHASSWSVGGSAFNDQTDLWSRRWRELARLAVQADGGGGSVTASMAIDLYPVFFPRDTVLTRIPPLAVTALLNYLVALEDSRPAPQPAPAPPTPPPPPPQPDEPEPEAEVVIVTIQPVEPETPHSELELRWRQRLTDAEAALRQARLDRDAALRRLDSSREWEKTLAVEAMAARQRADRLGERYDESLGLLGGPGAPASLELARLYLERDAILERLAKLLQTSTEEHPFVRLARRELVALETLIARHEADTPVDTMATERETRLRNLRLEFEAARTQADNLDERRRRLAAEVHETLAAVTVFERLITDRELETARILQERPQPAVAQTTPAPAPRAVRTVVREPVAVPEPEVATRPEMPVPTTPGGAITFDAPRPVVLAKTPPTFEAPILGALAGLGLGLLCLLIRELTASRFLNASEARRLVGLPLLATLPAFDPKSVRLAAGSLKGELVGNKAGAIKFVPLPVEVSEPIPATRRERIRPAKRRLRLAGWLAGLAMLALTGAIFNWAPRVAQPPVAFAGEMALPAQQAYDLAGAGNWGDLP